jgi:hypothetical protein
MHLSRPHRLSLLVQEDLGQVMTSVRHARSLSPHGGIDEAFALKNLLDILSSQPWLAVPLSPSID